MAHQVFISYSHKDRMIADALCHWLEEYRIKCWIAPRDIKPGESWAGEIVESIQKSRVLILIFSSSANKSKQVLREVEMAINNDVVLIPLRIEDVLPTGSMSYFLANTHWIDALDDKMESKFSQISERIASLLGIELQKSVPAEAAGKTEKPPAGISKKRGKKRKAVLVKVLAGILVTVMAALAVIFVPRYLNSREQEASETNHETGQDELWDDTGYSPEDLDLDPDMTVIIEDDALNQAVMDTFEMMGMDVENGITIEDMFRLKCLVITSQDNAYITEQVFDEELKTFFLSKLVISSSSIKSLEGLQYARNLDTLLVIDQGIRDLSPLEDLDMMEYLYLHDNKIEDINFLGKMAGLVHLMLGKNLISDISVLEFLPSLVSADFSYNDITDISFLTKAGSIEDVSFYNNKISDIGVLGYIRHLNGINLGANLISDISVLSSLRKMQWLVLSENDISDISPLRDMEDLSFLVLYANKISDIGPLKYLTNLTYLDLNNNFISDVDSLGSLGNLQVLRLSVNNITGIKPLAALGSLEELNIEDNNIGDMEYVENLQSLVSLTVSSDQYHENLNILKGIVNRGCEVYIADTGEVYRLYGPDEFGWDPDMVVEVHDGVLFEVLLETFKTMGHDIDGDITVGDMFELRVIAAAGPDMEPEELPRIPEWHIGIEQFILKTNSHIEDLEPLRYAANLQVLILGGYEGFSVSGGISFLGEDLPSLEILMLPNDHISDLAPIEGKTNIWILKMPSNDIEDIGPVGSLNKLEALDLSSNAIKDIGVLQGMDIQRLFLDDNQIEQLDPLGGLENLNILSIAGNNIGSVDVIGAMTELKSLVIDQDQYDRFMEELDGQSNDIGFEIKIR